MPGAGRKIKNSNNEEVLVGLIKEERAKKNRVSRRQIKSKALSLNKEDVQFKASNGWLENFLDRNNLSRREKTTDSIKSSTDINNKIANYILFVNKMRKDHLIKDDCIIAMDETSSWFDMGSCYIIDTVGVNNVPIKTTGHEKTHYTVVLSAKGNIHSNHTVNFKIYLKY